MIKDSIAIPVCASGPTARAQNVPGGRLGTNGRTASALAASSFDTEAITRARYQLRDHAGRLMPTEAVARCGRHLAPNAGGVSVLYSPSAQAAFYGGLEACHSVWMCPCCAAKITERRRVELTMALRQARSQGFQVVMITYTFEHHAGQPLRSLLGAMKKGWKRYKGGRQAHDLYQQVGVIGSVRALEVTYGDSNGWHPHIHELVFLPAVADVDAFGRRARGLWEDAAAAAGLSMNEHGFKLDKCDEKVAEYVAKFNRLPGLETQKAWEAGWTEANELTKWHTKQGRSATLEASEHVTPMELLRYAVAGDVRAAQLFREYAEAYKGQRQLYWSAGLKARFTIKDLTDKEVAEKQEEDGESLAFLQLEEWRVVLGNDARVDLLMVARTGDRQKVYDFLCLLGLERFCPGGPGRRDF